MAPTVPTWILRLSMQSMQIHIIFVAHTVPCWVLRLSMYVYGASHRGRCQSSMVPEINPDAACMEEIERTERRAVNRQHHTSYCKLLREWLYIFVGRADFDFFVRFENTPSYINARRHAGST